MEVLIMGVCVAFNFLVILVKWAKLRRYADAITDFGIFSIIMYICKGSTMMISTGMVASAIVSIALLIKPIKIFKPKEY